MKIPVQVSTHTLIRFWLVIIGFILALGLIYLSRTALIIVGSAFFLALALSVPVNYLADKIPGHNRVGATTLSFIGVVMVLGVFFTLVVPPIVHQTSNIIDAAPQMLESFSDQRQSVGKFVERYELQPQLENAIASARESTDRWVSRLASGVITGVTSAAAMLAASVLTLVMTFLMLVEGPDWLKSLWGLYRDKSKMRRHKDLAERMYDVVTGYVVGQLAVAGVGAIASGLIVLTLSLFTEVPANLAVPSIAIAFLLALIPLFGSTIAGLLIALLLVFNSFWGAVIFAAAYIVYQQVESNIISPAIQSRYIHLTALTVLVATTIGIYLLGFIGAIIAIPVAGVVKVLISYHLEYRKKKPGLVSKLSKKAS